MKHAATLELYDYWTRLRGERAAPERGEVDPAAIRGILADTFILDVDAARRFPVRLSGSRVNALFTTELKERSFPTIWARGQRLEIVDLLEAVCGDAVAIVAGVQAAPVGREAIDLELLLLPVRHMGKTHARILGCLSPAALPSWIGLLPLEQLSLTSVRILTGAGVERRAEAPLRALPAVGAACGHHRAKLASARRGHLFVYEGGR